MEKKFGICSLLAVALLILLIQSSPANYVNAQNLTTSVNSTLSSLASFQATSNTTAASFTTPNSTAITTNSVTTLTSGSSGISSTVSLTGDLTVVNATSSSAASVSSINSTTITSSFSSLVSSVTSSMTSTIVQNSTYVETYTSTTTTTLPSSTGSMVQVVFLQNGLRNDAAGPVIIIDGTGYSYYQLPLSLTWVTGSTHTIVAYTQIPSTIGGQYYFQGWSDGGSLSHEITARRRSASYTVYYGPTQSGTVGLAGSVTVDSNIEIPGMIYVDGNLIVTPQNFLWQTGSIHSLSLSPGSNGYQFQYWQIDGQVYSYSQITNYEADGNTHTIVAIFNVQPEAGGGQPVPITITSNPLTGPYWVQVDGVQVSTPYLVYWTIGSTHTLSASPNTNGYIFQSWSVDGTQYTATPILTFQVDGPHTLTVTFNQPIPEFPSDIATTWLALVVLSSTLLLRKRISDKN